MGCSLLCVASLLTAPCSFSANHQLTIANCQGRISDLGLSYCSHSCKSYPISHISFFIFQRPCCSLLILLSLLAPRLLVNSSTPCYIFATCHMLSANYSRYTHVRLWFPPRPDTPYVRIVLILIKRSLKAAPFHCPNIKLMYNHSYAFNPFERLYCNSIAIATLLQRY